MNEENLWDEIINDINYYPVPEDVIKKNMLKIKQQQEIEKADNELTHELFNDVNNINTNEINKPINIKSRVKLNKTKQCK